MKKNIIGIIFIVFSLNTLFSQTNKNSIIINDSRDIIETPTGKIVSFYTQGLSQNQVNDFNIKIKSVLGVSLYFLKVTDNNLKMAHGKIKIQTNFDKDALKAFFQKYSIAHIVINGKHSTIENFFEKRENGKVVKR